MLWLTDRLKEKSTLATLITLAAGLLARASSPSNQDIIMNSLVTVLTAIGIMTPEKKK